jgi:membrane protein required for colicin V production
MNWADWAIVGVVAISALISLKRGFVKEALSLLIWLAATAVAINFYETVSEWLVNLIDVVSLRLVAAWVGLFIVTLITGSIVSYLVSKLVEATGLSGTDRLFGVLFGVVRGLIVVLVLLILAPQVLPVHQDQWWIESLFIPHFLEFESWARSLGAAIFDGLKQGF